MGASQSDTRDCCTFPRDLAAGAFGGDVYCLSSFLHEQGLLHDKPSGYYSPALATAVAAWQKQHGLVQRGSIFATPERALYSKLKGVPLSVRRDVLDAGSDDDLCVVVRASCAALECTETVRFRGASVSASARHDACREACHVAFAAACDRAYPLKIGGGPAEDVHYNECLSHMASSCLSTCGAALKNCEAKN